MTKVKVVLVQLGSPEAPTSKSLRKYLKEFLGDPRVVDINPLLWKIILNCFVLPFRPKKSAKLYSRIWDGDGFPLVKMTVSFAKKVQSYLPDHIECEEAFLLSSPTAEERLVNWSREDTDQRAQSLYVIPQFPQYSEATIASGFDNLAKGLGEQVNIPDLHFVSNFHRLKAFIDLSAKKINESIEKNNLKHLVISFHGIPERRVVDKGDLYYRHCYETFFLIKDKINLPPENIHSSFQSRFGSEKWLGPYTDENTVRIAKENDGAIGIYSPSFVVDCLETTDELGHELVEDVKEVGGELHQVRCLNDDDDWCKEYAKYIETLVDGSRKDQESLFYDVDAVTVKADMPKLPESTALSPESKKSLSLVFLTLFIDLVGFSLIFPLFPSMADFYWKHDSENVFLKWMFDVITKLGAEPNSFESIVLFGGLLGALYSLLQFFASPFWGSLSDRIGRRPVLLVSLFGIFLSYVIWIFSQSFTVLLLSRLIAGFMSGNLSTASAVVSDITSEKNRSKGMAIIGIAFATGFILGPAIGGLSALWNPLQSYPQLSEYGINPFSLTASIGALLALVNLILMNRHFKETLKNKNTSGRTSNLLTIFTPLPYPQVNKVNLSYFIFITAFSGMEFTLTFLAVERLQYTPWDNAKMFIFIGFIIAFVQGGYVRRKSHIIGEKLMAVRGLAMVIPGLILVAVAHSSLVLYLGLFLLATGSSMAIPNLTTLVSLLSPKELQGKSLGIFRSFGSLSRVLGPLGACLIYWRYGSAGPYYISVVGMVMALLVLKWVIAPKSETA